MTTSMVPRVKIVIKIWLSLGPRWPESIWKKKTRKEQRKKIPRWLSQACVGGHGSSLACVGLHGLSWVLVGLLWPSLACSGCRGFWLACVGCYAFSLAFVGLHWPALAFVGPSGLRWLLWAFVGLRRPSLTCVGREANSLCHSVSSRCCRWTYYIYIG
jgi:hypothetical protein